MQATTETIKFELNNLSDIPAVVKKLLADYSEARVFAFYGELGAGKTTLIKEFCRFLKVKDTVSSPTFAIINEYNSENGENIYHADLYRLKNEKEVIDTGLGEYVNSGNYCFIEWPALAENLLPENTVKLYIQIEGEKRTIVKG